MFAVIQAIICTVYFVVFLSEAVTENGPAPCFLKETHHRVRVNRAVNEATMTKSLNSENSKKEELSSAEKKSPILIKSLNSEKIQKEDESSLNKESLKANVTDSVQFITTPENSQKEENLKEKESPKSNLTDSAQIIIKSLNLNKMRNKEEPSRENELPKANLTDSAQMTEKESAVATNSSNLDKSKGDEKNETEENAPITVKTLSSESAKNEEENSTDTEAVLLNKSSKLETRRKEGNVTENDSLKANLSESVEIAMKSSEPEKIKEEGNSTRKKIQREEGNSTEKESAKENVTASEQVITKAPNSENAKIEEGKLIGKESILKNLTTSSRKSITKGKKQRTRRENMEEQLSETEQDEAGKAFITAYKKCKLLKGKHFIRVAGVNPKETKKCVLQELQKLETYPNEFIKYLENKEIIRKP